MITYIFAVLVISLCAALTSTQANDNQCSSSSPFTDMDRRYWKYKLGSGEQAVPDYFIDNSLQAWYGSPGVDLWNAPPGYASCGCKFPIWMRDLSGGKAEMCLQIPTNECDRTFIINATRCGTHNVYQLVKTPLFESAYCIDLLGSAPPAVSLSPSVAVDHIPTEHTSEIIIYCDFNTPMSGLFYQTIWYVNNNWVHTSAITRWSSTYRSQSALTEAILISRGIVRLGFDTHCEVIPRSSVSGRPGTSSKSERKFLGIKVDKLSLTVNGDSSGEIYLQSTAPISCGTSDIGECTLPVEVHVRKSPLKNPNDPDALVESLCGVNLDKTNPDGSNPRSNPLRIRPEVVQSGQSRNGVTKFSLQTTEHLHMRMWSNVNIGEVSVYVRHETSIADGKYCKLYLDPHVKTFDRKKQYGFMRSGYYTLYKHTVLPIEVQMHFLRCSIFSSATCGNGAAIRVGRTVFRITRPSINRSWTASYASCEQNAMIVKKSGKDYMIYFPTGMYLKIKLVGSTGFSSRLDVYIYPTSEDINKSAGLCGTLNGNPADDVGGSWGVSDKNNLFWNVNLQNLEPWFPQYYTYCTCDRDGNNGGNLHPEITCSPQLTRNSKNKPFSGRTLTPKTHKCFITERRRRAVQHLYEHSVNRRASTVLQEKKVNRRAGGDYLKTRNSSQTWDEARSTELCNSVFNRSAAIKACASINETDVEENVEACVHDVQAMQDPEIALSAVEASKTTCLLEAMMDADIQNETKPGAGTIFEQVNAIICPFDCSGQGVCNNGTCDCDETFGAEDCSVKLTDPPVTYGLSNDGYCDVMNETCDEAMVLTEYVIDAAKCNIQPFTIDLNNDETTEDTVTVEPEVDIFTEAACPIPPEREERSVSGPPPSATYKGYRVSVSNDGITFSKEDILIVYNSECQRCTILGDSVQCEFVVPACISNGACVKPGEFHPTIPCYKCDERKPGEWTRAKGEGCQEITEYRSLLWIIGAVVGGIALSVTVLGLAWIISRKNKREVADSSTNINEVKQAWGYQYPLPSKSIN